MFEWDAVNLRHLRRHRGVTPLLVEQAMNDPMAADFGWDIVDGEERYHLVGATGDGRLLSVIYEVRGERVRVITAYWASWDERIVYEEGWHE